MDNKTRFREGGFVKPQPDTGMPRRMRFLRVSAGDLALTLLLCAAVLGLLMLGAKIDEPADPQLEALAQAERADLQAVKTCLLAQGARP